MQKTLMGQIASLREKQKALDQELDMLRTTRDQLDKEVQRLQVCEICCQSFVDFGNSKAKDCCPDQFANQSEQFVEYQFGPA